MTSTLALDELLERFRPASFAERLMVRYVRERLEERADPEELLDELEAAREEIVAWGELEQTHGIAEAMKLHCQWLTASWGTMPASDGRLCAVEWAARISGEPVPHGSELERLRASRRAADPIFNLWRDLNPNYGMAAT